LWTNLGLVVGLGLDVELCLTSYAFDMNRLYFRPVAYLCDGNY